MSHVKHLIIFAALAVSACGGEDKSLQNETENTAEATPEKVTLAGDWTSASPIVTNEDDMTTKMSNLRYTYFSDNKLHFSGQLSISGGDLPDAMNFKVTGDGTYIEEGKVLRQDIEKLSLSPSSGDAAEQAVADELEKILQREPSSVHDVLELSAKKLRLRERETGKIIELNRGA